MSLIAVMSPNRPNDQLILLSKWNVLASLAIILDTLLAL